MLVQIREFVMLERKKVTREWGKTVRVLEWGEMRGSL